MERLVFALHDECYVAVAGFGAIPGTVMLAAALCLYISLKGKRYTKRFGVLDVTKCLRVCQFMSEIVGESHRSVD